MCVAKKEIILKNRFQIHYKNCVKLEQIWCASIGIFYKRTETGSFLTTVTLQIAPSKETSRFEIIVWCSVHVYNQF